MTKITRSYCPSIGDTWILLVCSLLLKSHTYVHTMYWDSLLNIFEWSYIATMISTPNFLVVEMLDSFEVR